jgi:L-fuculose-phosphate aldolase
MKPDDICSVDMQGNQLSGWRKRSSEALLHLAIMKERPDVKSVVHCHPPHATAFAIAREPIPQCVLPEVEVFLGDVPITTYETPGGQAFADTVLPFVKRANVVILANHGTVSYGETVEKAYWWTEILDSYCRMLMMARDLGRVHYLSEAKTKELLELKQKWGYSDPRLDAMQNCDICANDTFRESWTSSGVERRAFEPPPPSQTVKSTAFGEMTGKAMGPATPGTNGSGKNGSTKTGAAIPPDQEALVQAITDRVMAALAQRS